MSFFTLDRELTIKIVILYSHFLVRYFILFYPSHRSYQIIQQRCNTTKKEKKRNHGGAFVIVKSGK